MSRNSAFWKIVAAISVSILMVMAVPMASAGSPPGPFTPPAGSTSWAYGGSWSCQNLGCLGENTTLTGSNFTMSYHVHIYLAYEAIYSALNTSTGVSLEMYSSFVAVVFISLSVTSTQGAYSGASVNANLSAMGYAVSMGYANVTTGTVNDNGTNVPATALLNAASNQAVNYTMSFSTSISGVPNENFAANGFASVGLSEQSSVTFSPALGLFPTSPTTGEVWTSNSSFAGSGSYSGADHYFLEFPASFAGDANTSCPAQDVSGPNCVEYGGHSANAAVTASGFLALIGTDLGPVSVVLPSGQSITVDLITIGTTGPWGFTGGIILVPETGITGSGPGGIPISSPIGILSTPRPAATPAVATASGTEKMDYNPNDPTHVGIVDATSGSLGSATLGAAPQTVSTAETTAQGNLQLLNQGSSSSGGSGALVLIILIAVVVAVVVAVAVVVVVSRRRKRPAMAPAPQQQMAQPQQPYQYAQAPPPPAPQQAPPPYAYPNQAPPPPPPRTY
jgi:hypothetical protein